MQTVSFASRRGRMVPIQFVTKCGAWVEGDRSCIGAASQTDWSQSKHDNENYRYDIPRAGIESAVTVTVAKTSGRDSSITCESQSRVIERRTIMTHFFTLVADGALGVTHA